MHGEIDSSYIVLLKLALLLIIALVKDEVCGVVINYVFKEYIRKKNWERVECLFNRIEEFIIDFYY